MSGGCVTRGKSAASYLSLTLEAAQFAILTPDWKISETYST